MSPLMTTILNSATNTLETSALAVAAAVAIAIRIARPTPRVDKTFPVDPHTMADIGVERGSITWTR